MGASASPTANETTCSQEFTVVHAFSIVYFITVIVLGTVGNGLLLCVFIFNRALCKKSINYLICANTVVNFLISVLFDPIIAATNFVPCLESHRALFMVRLSSDFFLEVCVVSSIYTLTAVAANQYLLISRPNTTYRRCCTGRKAVSIVLTLIWLLALVVVMLFWFVERSLVKLHEKHQEGHRAIEISFVLPCILNYCPLIIIPCFQWGTMRTIRASRERVANKAAPSAATVPTTVSSVSSPSETRGLSLDGGPTTSMPLQPPMVADKNDDDEKKVRRRGKNELRTQRTMMVMYMILVVSWTPSLMAWASVSVGLKLNKVLDLFGAFLSVYPALIPFAYMWTNKNYSNVLRKKIWSKIRPQ
ncbi:5-hydroxytryptamine receptor 1F-like [Strongylocentrotus purpuratus]|uniref:G-protein coupled receptors family 1 profile domain-containing protein n=1 Tax=Strongylocentrotus purpuratus TaxID=7668 RepID=A0A7M7HHV6_STRPU|nr:5-hydroxytryptamine receptor 1F-like [Strongylocentrotus purpuratus]|eukprot:XP_011669439.1 PREDICTED: 5-hydroxytryptamine receptor 1F-like [Strongylocentrotus purpuratus]